MTKPTEDVLMINGQEIPVEIYDISHGDLKYYPDNPRIYSIVSGDGGIPDQAEIEKRLKSMDHVKVLIQSIRSNGGLTDPLIVRNGDMVVLEGNSRLAAYRALAGMDPVKWGKIRCKVLPNDIDDSLVYSLLGQYHIIGRTDWAPYEQAGYLYRRHKKHNMDLEKMADEMGLKKTEVKRLVSVYSFMVKHQENETTRWSYYEEYLKPNVIKRAREKFPNFDDLVVEKIRGGEIDKAVDIREKLTKIAVVEKVLSDFAKGKKDFDTCFENAIERGAGNEWLKRFSKFREAIASDSAYEEVHQMTGTHKDRCVYELKKIKSRLSTLMTKLGID